MFSFFNNFSHFCGYNSHIIANNFQIYNSSSIPFILCRVNFQQILKISMSIFMSCNHLEFFMCKTQAIFFTLGLLLPLHFQTKLMKPSSLSLPVYKSSIILWFPLVHPHIQIKSQFCRFYFHTHMPTTFTLAQLFITKFIAFL